MYNVKYGTNPNDSFKLIPGELTAIFTRIRNLEKSIHKLNSDKDIEIAYGLSTEGLGGLNVYNYLTNVLKVSNERAIFLLTQIGGTPESDIHSIEGAERQILNVEKAYANANCVVINTTGIAYHNIIRLYSFMSLKIQEAPEKRTGIIIEEHGISTSPDAITVVSINQEMIENFNKWHWTQTETREKGNFRLK